MLGADIHLYPAFEPNLPEAEHAQRDNRMKFILREEGQTTCESKQGERRPSLLLSNSSVVPENWDSTKIIFSTRLSEATLTEVKHLKKQNKKTTEPPPPKNKTFKKMYLFYCWYFCCMYVCEPCACLVFMEATRGCQAPWNWSYGWLGASR